MSLGNGGWKSQVIPMVKEPGLPDNSLRSPAEGVALLKEWMVLTCMETEQWKRVKPKDPSSLSSCLQTMMQRVCEQSKQTLNTLCPAGQNASEYFPEGHTPWLVASCRCYWEQAWTMSSFSQLCKMWADTTNLGRGLASQGCFFDISKPCCVWWVFFLILDT